MEKRKDNLFCYVGVVDIESLCFAIRNTKRPHVVSSMMDDGWDA